MAYDTRMSMTADAAFSITQFRDAWRLLCAATPATVTETAEGVDYIFSGIPIAFFNVAIVNTDQITAEQLAASGRRALEWAAPSGVPWLFLVTHDALAADVDATAALEPCGLVPMLAMTGMIAHRIAPPSRTAERLAVTTVSDDAACVAALDINAAAYGISLEAANAIYGRRTFWDSHVLALGYVDDTPVASTAVMQVDGCRYVALVATLPDRQRHGYAEAVMRHALDVSAVKFGNQPTMLHATDAGRPVYARMGYEAIASHTAFIDKAFLAGH
jgi:hypothetical protein